MHMQWLHKLHVLLEFRLDKTLGRQFCQISQNLSPNFKPELFLLTPKVCHKIVKETPKLENYGFKPKTSLNLILNPICNGECMKGKIPPNICCSVFLTLRITLVSVIFLFQFSESVLFQSKNWWMYLKRK